MGLTGKISFSVEIKSDGNTFHELLKLNPRQVPFASPDTIEVCNLHEGEFGTPGSIISWNYFLDGKKCFSKQIIHDVSEEKRSITFKCIEGELMELYKTFYYTYHVDQNGETSFVTWTYEYEKLNEDVPDPDVLLKEFHVKLTKDIEAHHLKK